MTIPKMDWNRVFEFAWRILVFIVAVGIIIVVSTNWTRWEGGAGWQTTNDAYLQADLTPISAKVAGYVRELPIQDFEHVHKGQVLAQLVDDDYRAAAAQAEAGVATALAQAQALKAQHALQLANVEAAHAVVASTTASFEQNGRDFARQRRLLETGSSSTEASEKLSTTHAQLEAQLMQNRAQARAAERQLALGALKETEQALVLYSAALDNRQALGDAQDKVHAAFGMAHDQFLAGSLSNLDLLTTEQSLVAVDAAVASSDAALVQDQIAVFKALGGGWRSESEPAR
jgi:multidrug resistance efflux pump